MPLADSRSLFMEEPKRTWRSGLGQSGGSWRAQAGSFADDAMDDSRFGAFRQAWRGGASDADLFGDKPFDLKGSVGAGNSVNRRADVAKVETFLGRTGHYKPLKDGPSGYVSNSLDEAIRGFQTDNGLDADGILNPGGPTIAALRKIVAGRPEPVSAATSFMPMPKGMEDHDGTMPPYSSHPIGMEKLGFPPKPTSQRNIGNVFDASASLLGLAMNTAGNGKDVAVAAKSSEEPNEKGQQPMESRLPTWEEKVRWHLQDQARKRLEGQGLEVVDDDDAAPLAGNRISRSEHQRMIEEAAKSSEWTLGDGVKYKLQKDVLKTPPRERDLAAFKDDFVKDNATTIKVMARKNGIPPEVLAGILHTEAGGMPDVVDNAANLARSAAQALPDSLRDTLPIPDVVKVPSMRTSAGSPSIQLRNVAKLEGMNPEKPDVLDRQKMIERLQDDKLYAIDMAARHVREEILNKAYPDYDGEGLTDEQVRTIGYGYNLGYPHRGLDPENPDPKRIGKVASQRVV